MKARMYDPTIGRFLSQDPIKVGDSALDVNPYIYTANNPLTHIDPTGKYIETALDVAGLAYDANAFRKNHSLENGAFLLWSAAAVVLPIVPGSYVGRAVKVAQIAKNAEKVDKAYTLYKGSNVATGYTRHGIDQAISRNGVGVSIKAIFYAVKSPKNIVKQTGGRIKYIGRDAVVVLSREGKVITTWARNRRGWRIR